VKYLFRLCLLLIPVVLCNYGYVYFAFTEPNRPVEDLTEKWAKPSSQFLSLSGMQVHFRDEGPNDDPLSISVCSHWFLDFSITVAQIFAW
jgi:hypothetical protein